MTNTFSLIASDLGRTVAQAKPLLMKLDNADTSVRPSENKWAKKEILGHLLDSASNNHQRFVRATLQGSLTFPGYDQNAAGRSSELRRDRLEFPRRFLGRLQPLSRPCDRPPAGRSGKVTCNIGNNAPATLGWIAEDYVAHLKHHLNQILGQTFETSYGAKG